MLRLMSILLPATHSCPSIKSASSVSGLIKSEPAKSCKMRNQQLQKMWIFYSIKQCQKEFLQQYKVLSPKY